MRKQTAIVVDRDRRSAAQIEKVLKHLHFNVIVLAELQCILEVAKSHPLSLLLVSAPSNSSASDVCRQLRSLPGRKFIILLLEQLRQDSVTTAFAIGADDAIAKPIIVTELATRLRNASLILQLEDLRRESEEDGALFSEIAARSSFHSRRYLQAQLEHEISRAARFMHSLSLVLTEVRVSIPDDRVIRHFGRLLSEQVRSHIDWIARYSDQSFVIVLPETGLAGAMRTAGRLRDRLQSGLSDDVLRTIVASDSLILNFGVCTCDTTNSVSAEKPDIAELLEAAETYLQDAMRAGSNHVAGGLVHH